MSIRIAPTSRPRTAVVCAILPARVAERLMRGYRRPHAWQAAQRRSRHPPSNISLDHKRRLQNP